MRGTSAGCYCQPAFATRLNGRLQFLGQFSPVDQVELRAQVGGTLTYIGFKDGDVVPKGALLFVIDPTPYQIKFDESTAQVAKARARLELAATELRVLRHCRRRMQVPSRT